FTYTVIGDYAGPLYFRGVDETLTFGGEWRYPNQAGLKQLVGKNQTYLYAEDYQKLAIAGVQVRMLRPPIGNSDIVFYPGQLDKVDRVTMGSQVPITGRDPQSALLYSVDRLSSVQPNSSAGVYTATVAYSTANTSELEAAGTSYPAWLDQYSHLPQRGYRAPAVIDKIHALAQSIVDAAGARTPYDQAAAIEAYLRDSRNFEYSLDARTPDGFDPIDYFLFTSHKGYCEFFATAMGDMLRSLGIPTRLVNGFGKGTFDTTVNAFVVRGERNLGGASALGGNGFHIGALDATALMRIFGVFVALLLLLLVVLSRYLRPRTVTTVWKRMLTLASLAGARRRPGETPLELGRRLQRTFPEAAQPVGQLASGFVVPAYAPPAAAATSRA